MGPSGSGQLGLSAGVVDAYHSRLLEKQRVLATILLAAIAALALFLITAACFESSDEFTDAERMVPVRSRFDERQKMNSRNPTDGTSTKMVWAGRALSALVIVFLLLDGAMKVMQLDVVRETMTGLGYPAHVAFGLGILTLAIAVLYAIPRTSVLGAILLTGLLGGAMATHLRVGSPIFSHLLFGGYVGLLAWAGLFLRDQQVRAFLLRHE